jgi:hypothetical protein
MCLYLTLRRDECFQGLLRPLRVSTAGEAKSLRNSVHVRVHGKSRPSQREGEHTSHGLRADARERAQIITHLLIAQTFEARERQSALSIHNLAENRFDPGSFGVGEASDRNRSSKLRVTRGENRLPGREMLPQARPRAIAVRVAGVLRENGEHELFERRARIGNRSNVVPRPVGAREPLDDLARPIRFALTRGRGSRTSCTARGTQVSGCRSAHCGAWQQ